MSNEGMNQSAGTFVSAATHNLNAALSHRTPVVPPDAPTGVPFTTGLLDRTPVAPHAERSFITPVIVSVMATAESCTGCCAVPCTAIRATGTEVVAGMSASGTCARGWKRGRFGRLLRALRTAPLVEGPGCEREFDQGSGPGFVYEEPWIKSSDLCKGVEE